MNSEPPIIIPEPDPFWRENAQKLVSESISTIEEVAKQLIIVNSLLEGIYFHAIAFSQVKIIIVGLTVIVYLIPIFLWLVSLFFAVVTLSPKAYLINIKSSRASKETFEEIVLQKHRMLKFSEAFLILSFIALIGAIAHYLLSVP